MDLLKEKGFDDETIAFLTGKLARKASDKAMADVLEAVSKEEAEKMKQLKKDELMNRLDEEFKKAKGVTYKDHVENVYGELVRDYEKSLKASNS